MRSKYLKAAVLILTLTAVLFTQSCMFTTPGGYRVVGVRGLSENGFSYFALNLGVAEVAVSLTNFIGIGFSLGGLRPIGLFTRTPVKGFPGIHVSLLPILFRNIGLPYGVFSIRILSITVGF